MNFHLDKQTNADLEVFQTSEGKSLYDFFNQCKTYGGKQELTKIMSTLSTDIDFLNERIETIRYFHSNPDIISSLIIDKNTLDFIEHYLNYGNYPTRKTSKIRAIENALIYKIKPNNDYYIVERGIEYTIELLNILYRFFTQDYDFSTVKYLNTTREEIISIFTQSEFKPILEIKKSRKLKAIEIATFDYVFRYTHKSNIRFCIDLVYYLDALFAVCKVANKHHFCFPDLLSSDKRVFKANNLFHPLLENAVSNDVNMDKKMNFMFITGPNMSGKSTFLKSLGIAAYLAHIGFPVPAKTFSISMLSGIYTTINLKDSLHANYSHFYAEVKRIKEIAQKLTKDDNMLIIFDELFRGTNVKDAFDGSLAIISAFAETNNSFYVVSTHILEVAEKLNNKNIRFMHLETRNDNEIPVYTYKLKTGISNERLGMYIINKEKIIEIINNIGL
ncbi:MAG: DNA mismatch repair protein MutS [Bacteroidetes bacterium ADurb.BinA174]|nr:MAG: DNA mismatch repair protein MutS [Bacteroidetes bacterium ADurb.BinA174]